MVVRSNIIGDAAMILTRNGELEGSAVDDPILVRHFSFGWQPIALLNDACSLRVHGIPADAQARLMRGIPKPSVQPRRGCDADDGDAGPAADIEAIRHQMLGPLVPWVAVAGDFAVGQWYGAGGGQTLFHKHNGRWTFVAGGGGARNVREMRAAGVPQDRMCALRVYDAYCRPSHVAN
jgi:hypothetical protein